MQHQQWFFSDAQRQKGSTVSLSRRVAVEDFCRAPVSMMSHWEETLYHLFWFHVEGDILSRTKEEMETQHCSHIYSPWPLTFRWRAWLIPDWVKAGLSFFFFLIYFAKLTNLICPFFVFLSHPKAPCHGLRLAQMRNTCCTVFYELWLNRLSCWAPAGINRLLDVALSSPLGRALNEKWVKLTRNGV